MKCYACGRSIFVSDGKFLRHFNSADPESLKVCEASLRPMKPCTRCGGRGFFYTRNHDDGDYFDCTCKS